MSEIKNGIKGSEFWVNSSNLSFLELQNASNLMTHWKVYGYINHLCQNFAILPINKYVLDLYPKPQILSIVKNVVTFRQRTHAEIWVQPEEDSLYALDKCWQRQFYPSSNKMIDESCFDATYKFYMPWIPHSIKEYSIKIVKDESTPFHIKEKILELEPPGNETDFYETEFIEFMIKKTGNHMINDKYGIIDIGTAMYDISVEMSEEQIEKLSKQYRN
jgi:hypothetical protein